MDSFLVRLRQGKFLHRDLSQEMLEASIDARLVSYENITTEGAILNLRTSIDKNIKLRMTTRSRKLTMRWGSRF